MEVKMHQLQYVLDFVAANFALFESITSGKAPRSPGVAGAEQQPLRFEVSPHARIGRHFVPGRRASRQVVVVQLAVQPGCDLYCAVSAAPLGRQTREATDVAAHLITQRCTGSAALLQRSTTLQREQPKRISSP